MTRRRGGILLTKTFFSIQNIIMNSNYVYVTQHKHRKVFMYCRSQNFKIQMLDFLKTGIYTSFTVWLVTHSKCRPTDCCDTRYLCAAHRIAQWRIPKWRAWWSKLWLIRTQDLYSEGAILKILALWQRITKFVIKKTVFGPPLMS